MENFSEECQLKADPSHLLLLLGLILEGSKDLNISDTTASVASKLSQLARFNAVKKKRTGINCCHTKKNEPPLPVLIGLAVYSQTGEKKIREKLYSNGLCISYDRVIEVENNITKDLCQKKQKLFVHYLYTLVYLHVRQSITLTTTLLRQHQRVSRNQYLLFQYPTKEMQNKRFIYT